MPRSSFALAAAIALVVAATAAAATTTVSLNLKGGYANRTLKACGLTHHYTVFRRRHAIAMGGVVRPAPQGSFRVKLKVKECLGGRFQTVWVGYARVRPDGSFKGTFGARRSGFFFARAYDLGRATVKSDKQYFRVG